MKTLRLHLRDLSPAMVAAWRQEFDGVPNVECSCGDIFSAQSGPVSNDAPVDIRADAVVSPANSFGFMNGGIDAVYTFVLGPQVQERVQEAIRRDFDGELPVGAALIVPTGRDDIAWCVSAPTMRVPEHVPRTLNAFLAMRAALLAVRRHNARHGVAPIKTLLCPGLGTSVGRMPVERCARQMRSAWDEVTKGVAFPRSLTEAGERHDALLR